MKLYYFLKKIIITESLGTRNEPGERNGPFQFKKTHGQEHEAASVKKALLFIQVGCVDGNQT